MTRVAMMVVVALGLWQCSGNEEKITAVKDCSAAVTAFTSNIQPHVKTDSCDASGCHASAEDTGGFALKADTAQASSNRANMQHEVEEHDLLDADKLWNYLSGVTDDEGNPNPIAADKHPGWEKLGGLDKTKVTAWVAAEKACP